MPGGGPMRIWHLALMILVSAVILAITKEAFGRVMLVMLATGIGEVALGTAAVMTLFRTVGAVGEADGLLAHVEALTATALVLLIASASMIGLLWLGVVLLMALVA